MFSQFWIFYLQSEGISHDLIDFFFDEDRNYLINLDELIKIILYNVTRFALYNIFQLIFVSISLGLSQFSSPLWSAKPFSCSF